ncbi:MAG TPA: STAS domain-containing protein [Gaiellales bacterium]|jgi:anti-anti-sigma factor|nr:STAS domain-containing protein [Gaiellales bacterium]
MTAHDAKREAFQAATRLAGIELAFHRLGVAIVTLRGPQGAADTPAISEALLGALPQLIVLVDLSECTSIDSAVVAALADAAAELQERGGELALIIPPKAAALQRVAKVAGLGELLPIHATRGAAIAGVRHNEHEIHIRDLRLRFGDPELRAAECSCGWVGGTHTGRTAERSARREATLHVDGERGR